jgi:hypothetical protein
MSRFLLLEINPRDLQLYEMLTRMYFTLFMRNLGF